MGQNAISENAGGHKLKREMGFWDLVLYGLVFMYPLAAINYLGYEQVVSNGHATLVYLGGGVIVFFTTLSYAKWVETFPNTGSAYFYTCRGVGPKSGFVVGWVMMLDYILTPLFIFIMIGEYMARNFPVLPFAVWMLLFAGIVFAINILGLKLSKIFDVGMLTIIMIIAISVSVLSAIYLRSNDISLWNPAVIYNADTFDFGNVSMAAALVLLSFLGFDAITTLSEESKCTPKNVSKAVIVAVIAQALLLGFLAYVGSCVFPDANMIEDPDTVAYELYMTIGGENFNFVMNLLSQFGLLACASCATTGATRVLYAMGRDNVLPRKIFGHLDKKGIPSYCVIVVMGLSIVGALFLEWAVVAEIVSFGAMFGFMFVNISCIRYFWFKKKEKKVLRNLICPIIGLAGVIFVLIKSAPICKIVGIIWIVCGLVYLIVKWKTSQDFRYAIKNGMDIE